MSLYLINNETAKQNAIREIDTLDIGKGFQVVIKDKKSTRSIQQNALYWKWIQIFADYMGHTKEDMHRTFSIRLLAPELFVVDGSQYVMARSTTQLSTTEFTEYLDGIQMAAIEMGITLPSPSHYGYDF